MMKIYLLSMNITHVFPTGHFRSETSHLHFGEKTKTEQEIWQILLQISFGAKGGGRGPSARGLRAICSLSNQPGIELLLETSKGNWQITN